MATDKIKGGLADGLTPADLAKKHSISIEAINKEIAIGIKIEMEHTDKKPVAREIAMDHIEEHPKYYSDKEAGLVK